MRLYLSLVLPLLCASLSAHSAQVAVLEGPTTLDWHRAYTITDHTVIAYMVEGLTRMGHDLQVQPALAQSWEMSSDGRRYVFTLRSDARWSDGKAVTAEDVALSWQRLMAPELAGHYSDYLKGIVGARDYVEGRSKDWSKVGVKAKGPTVLEVLLEKPDLTLPVTLSYFPFAPMPAVARAWSAAQWAAPVNLPSNAPFRLKEFSAGRGVRFVPNESYGVATAPEDLSFLIMPDRSEALEKLKAGLIDGVTDATRLDYVKIATEKEGVAKLLSVGALSTVYVGFNRRAPLIDTELRRILARGVSRKAIVQALGNDDREALGFIHPLVSGGGYETPLKENQAGARADLKAWLAKKNMKTMNLRLIARTGQRAESARALASAWQKAFPGLVVVTVQDFNSKALEAKIKEGNDFDAIVAAWLADFPDGLNFLNIFTAGQFQNVIQFISPQYDQAVSAASQALVPAERKRHLRAAEDILVGQEAAVVPLLHLNTAMLVSVRALRLKMDMLQRIYSE